MEALFQLEKLSEIKPTIKEKMQEHQIQEIKTETIEILQLNITRKCNLHCKHCHVDAGLHIEEFMPEEIMQKCIELSGSAGVKTVDITGGAPELNPHLEWLLSRLYVLQKRIIVRTNLVILKDPLYSKYLDIYPRYGVEIAASLPFYDREKYERQRGLNLFNAAISVLKDLNKRGYGQAKSKLVLDIVHNPVGAYLSANQKVMEFEYKKNLREKHGILFNNLFIINNMPIGRYLLYLIHTDNYNDYTNDLIKAFNPLAVRNIMCKNTLNVSSNGTVFNCDFNQMLQIPLIINGKTNILHLTETDLKNLDIMLHNHCYACTAGEGSGCQGTLV